MGPRPDRHTPRPRPSLPTSLHERNIAPAGHPTAWLTSSVKETSPPLAKNWRKSPLSSMQGRRIFHGTSRRGGFSFTPAPPLPHKRDKIRPARLHQRPCGTKFAQHAQNRPKSAVFRQQGEFCLGLTQNPDLLGEFYLAHEHPRFHPRRTLRPQPKPCVACAHATTPVPHWPHD